MVWCHVDKCEKTRSWNACNKEMLLTSFGKWGLALLTLKPNFKNRFNSSIFPVVQPGSGKSMTHKETGLANRRRGRGGRPRQEHTHGSVRIVEVPFGTNFGGTETVAVAGDPFLLSAAAR
jgi:hypothetical protein